MSFSQDLNRIQEIVKKLEEEPMPLEEAMEEFENGVGLVRKCQKFLDEAEQRVSLLSEAGTERDWNPLEESETGEVRE